MHVEIICDDPVLCMYSVNGRDVGHRVGLGVAGSGDGKGEPFVI